MQTLSDRNHWTELTQDAFEALTRDLPVYAAGKHEGSTYLVHEGTTRTTFAYESDGTFALLTVPGGSSHPDS